MVILKDVRDAIALHSQIPVGKHWSIRSVETPVSTSKTTTYAQRDKPRALMTRDPRNGLAQDQLPVQMETGRILSQVVPQFLCHSPPCLGLFGRKLDPRSPQDTRTEEQHETE